MSAAKQDVTPSVQNPPKSSQEKEVSCANKKRKETGSARHVRGGGGAMTGQP